MIDPKFLKVAKQAALEAGKLISERFGKKQKIYGKGDSSNFATQTDLDAEKSIIEIILRNFPDHNIICEERGEFEKKSDYTWVIDPLDGTISFAAGMPFFVVSIGLLYKYQPILGVIYWVAENKLYYAQKDKGAYLNKQRLQVSKVDKLENAVVGIDFAHINSRKNKFEKYIAPVMYKSRYPYALACDALTLALVAEGALDAFPTQANIWDFAGSVILVEEAGGKVTAPDGRPLAWDRERLDIVASNGLIHGAIVEALKQ